MEKIIKELEIAGKTISVETGRLAKQANGACKISVGDTSLLVTVVASQEPKENCDFMPLTVNYKERTYAAGKIPGGFFKREGRPRENEILVSRLIDRSIRPMLNENWHNETQVAAMLMSCDGVNDPDVLGIIGASIAFKLSDVPFHTPVSAVRIGRLDGNFIVNPTIEQQKTSDLNLVVSGTSKAISMVEAGANELSESEIVTALSIAHEEIKKICVFQDSLTSTSKEKIYIAEQTIDAGLINKVDKMSSSRTEQIVEIKEKSAREDEWKKFKKEVKSNLESEYPGQENTISSLLEDLFYNKARNLILEKKLRTDGRTFDEIRKIDCETGVLGRTHGSGLFTRGQTQALVTVTLGTPHDKQIMDDLVENYKERFMLHYNFPGFATGEAKPDRGTSRREMGHGALARKALKVLLPEESEFPYTLRVVSEILESNGSSSMASICGGSLALFDAGVPMKASCAGIAMGLVQEGDKYAILTDIMGMEDHLGDMDFKVAGTKKGITALQMDIKTTGLNSEILTEALEKARIARLKILDIMEASLSVPRGDLSTFAPRMVSIQIPQSKIGELIGPGGKNIRRIQEDSGADLEVEEDGKVFISSKDKNSVDLAKQMVEYFTADVEIGKTYKGKVTRILNFGAFVEILPGKEGLVHISQLSEEHIKKVDDVVSEGEEISVKVIEIDSQGRVNLSRKAALLDGKK